VIEMVIKYFEEASNQFYENSKLFDFNPKNQFEKLNTYAGLYNLAEGLKKIQETLDMISVQLEILEEKLNIE
jgi:hypothetical protein